MRFNILTCLRRVDFRLRECEFDPPSTRHTQVGVHHLDASDSGLQTGDDVEMEEIRRNRQEKLLLHPLRRQDQAE